jgi:hypothetical protein
MYMPIAPVVESESAMARRAKAYGESVSGEAAGFAADVVIFGSRGGLKRD